MLVACFSNDVGSHVIVALGSFDESAFGYLRQGGFSSFLYPLLHHVSF